MFQRRPNWCAPLNNGPISDEEMADIRRRYDEIFAACARTPGGFVHEPDRRGFFEVTPRGAAGAVGQALRRAGLRHLAGELPRDLHRRGGQRRVLRVHRRQDPPAGQRSRGRREADPARTTASACSACRWRPTTTRPTTGDNVHLVDLSETPIERDHRDGHPHHRARLRVRHHRLRHRLRRHHRRLRPHRHPAASAAQKLRDKWARRPDHLPRHDGPRLPQHAHADRPAERLGLDQLSARHRDRRRLVHRPARVHVGATATARSRRPSRGRAALDRPRRRACTP